MEAIPYRLSANDKAAVFSCFVERAPISSERLAKDDHLRYGNLRV